MAKEVNDPDHHFDPNAKGPLEGVRVVDLSRLVAGNMMTHLLADFGADVLKIEKPGAGDDLRNWRQADISYWWKIYARNKRSLSLDIKKKKGLEVLFELVSEAEILVENFVPGGLERLGAGPEILWSHNPNLIITRVSGWGQTGAYANRPGFGTLVEAMSGFADLNGFADRPPVLPPLATADMIAGLYGAFGAMVALREVELGKGVGQIIDLSLFEAMFSIVGSEAAKVAITGQGSGRTGNESAIAAPRNVYACADGRYVAISGSMQSMAERIFKSIGQPDLIHDPRFLTNSDRVANKDALNEIIAEFIGAKSSEEMLSHFEQDGVTAAPVASVNDLLDHPYVKTRQAIVTLADDEAGSLAMPNITPRLSRTPGAFRYPAPKLSQGNDEL